MRRVNSHVLDRLLSVGAAVLVVLVSRPGAADEQSAKMAEGAFVTILVLETLIPDVRVTLGDTDDRWVLSWPLVLTNRTFHVGDRAGIAVQPTVEPQYQVGAGEIRGAAGARVALFRRAPLFQLVPLVEAGAIMGTDGVGGFAGVGLGLGAPEIGIEFSFVVRVYETTEERRYEAALDLTIPFTSPEY